MKTQLVAWIDGDIKERAKILRINMSRVAEKALKEEIEKVDRLENERLKKLRILEMQRIERIEKQIQIDKQKQIKNVKGVDTTEHINMEVSKWYMLIK